MVGKEFSMKASVLTSICLCLVFILSPSGLSAADKKKGEIKEVETHQLTNQAYMAGFRQFAQGTGQKIQSFGKGTVRLFTAGNVGIDPKKGAELVTIGEQAVMGLEMWTGKQKMFTPRTKSEADAYCIVVLESDAAFDKFLAFIRERGTAKTPSGHEDLTKKLKTLHGPRCFFTTAKKFTPIGNNWMAHLSAKLALGTYYYERGNSPPIWMSISVNSEMERLLCGRQLIFTISYEDNKNASKGATPQGNWAKDCARLIRKGKKGELFTAHQIMAFDLIGMTYNQYIQLWSLGSFLRASTIGGSKKKNKFAKIIKRTANGEDNSNVVYDVFGGSDKNLTNAWHRWAVSQK